MSTSELVAEADRAAIAYQLALAKLGATTTVEAIRLFSKLNPTQVRATQESWLAAVADLVRRDRVQAQMLGMAFYRLNRALRTGRTVRNPFAPSPAKVVTLAVLRREFASALEGAPGSDIDAGDPLTADGEEPTSTLGQDEPNLEVNPSRIEVEDIDGVDDLLKELDAEAEEEYDTILQVLGPERLEEKRRAREERRKARESKWKVGDAKKAVDDLLAREKADREAVAKATAAAAERMALNGARKTVAGMADRDSRAIGFVRQSTTGTPCGWCAMLISRGLWFYTSKETASARRPDGSWRYHDNDKCIAVPVYSKAQYLSSNAYEVNRRLSKLWPEVTKGLSGKKAVSVWRSYIRRSQM